MKYMKQEYPTGSLTVQPGIRYAELKEDPMPSAMEIEKLMWTAIREMQYDVQGQFDYPRIHGWNTIETLLGDKQCRGFVISLKAEPTAMLVLFDVLEELFGVRLVERDAKRLWTSFHRADRLPLLVPEYLFDVTISGEQVAKLVKVWLKL